MSKNDQKNWRMTRNVEKGQQMSKDDLKCPKMTKNERNPWKWQQMSWTAYQFETSKNGLEFRNVEKQTEMSKNDQKCQKMTNSLRNYKKCLEILSNLKCQKMG